MKNVRIISYTILGIVLLVQTTFAQEVIEIKSIPAPEDMVWEKSEQIIPTPNGDENIVANVSVPTLTVYLPSKEKANGTAMVIAPGGGFHMLAIDNEGTEVAKWCVEHGIAAFVLKYRLVPTSGDPVAEFRQKISTMGSEEMDKLITPLVKLSKADGLAAIKYVRENASEYNVQPNKIGIIGFSAGGSVAGAAAYEYTSAADRPDFAAPIYPALQVVDTSSLPDNPMPMFIAVTGDDFFGFQSLSIDAFQQWNNAKQPVELHMYEKGGHGFGMRKQGLPSDQWINAFGSWLDQHDFIEFKL
ncbi:alpha/beta hydrolase [Allomuricauda sp. NBRC 101325]|uniref:alpha/beta hydrolase n=1 Tax=Allomuricauda sp. NBRC 101325 TaxID=1113758 RepID=UPI0024A522E9|nr:alpha/beta hydrolase [Muricauda sp. NBRC 101325]GLU45389.1 hypothetical protein Musp01_30130 [Muricauda sp. NBRC 101325]